MAKRIDQTYLYSLYPAYEKQLFQFVMSAERIDTSSEEFADILYDVKQRAVTNNMVKVLLSKKICLMIGANPLGKAVKVFTMKDVKDAPTERKTFIDVSAFIHKSESGAYACSNVDRLISHLISAMTQVIYYNEATETKLTDNVNLTKLGASAFSKLMFHIVDYIAKISSVTDAKEKCKALSCIYYQVSILGKDYNSSSVNNITKQVSGISERMLTSILVDYEEADFLNLKAFCNTLAEELRIPKLNPEAIVGKWMYVYDPSTTFALELFPAFTTMISDAYIGAYLNNQKTIQKVIDSDMVQFTKALLQIEGTM